MLFKKRDILSTLRPLVVFGTCSVTSLALGSGSYSGTVEGIFTNEQTAGWYLDANYNPQWFTDNNPVYTGDGTSSIVAGIPAPNSAPDQWSFVGANFTDVSPGHVFLLGQLEFFNGSDELGTDLFGGDLTLNFDLTEGSSVDPLLLHYQHVSTVNIGNQIHDADWLNFYQLQTSFHVYENAQGIANVYGEIVGDPYTTGLYLQIVPDANGNTNGWIAGNQQVLPSPGALFTFAAAGVAGLRRKRRA